MSETLHNRKLRLAAAEAMTSLALVGALAQPAEAKPDLAAGSEAAPARLISPDKLPGHNIRVSNETLNKLRGSTVVLGRQLGGDGRFGHWGTGVVVGELEDKVLVQVSAHQVLKNKEGYLNIPGKKAVDYFNLTADKFVIGDPTVVDAEQRMANPIGEVDAIAVSATANDAALLRVSRRSLPADGGATITPIDSKLRLDNPTERQSGAYEPKPVPGQQVAVFGVPIASGYKPVMNKGTFIKRIRIHNDSGSDNTYRLVDIVGIKSSSPDKDGCNFSGSGGSFAADIKGKPFVSGPSSRRINWKYDPGVVKWEGYNLTQTRAVLKNKWAKVQKMTGVNLSSFDTICEYSVLGSEEMTALKNSFGDYLQPEIGEPATGGSP